MNDNRRSRVGAGVACGRLVFGLVTLAAVIAVAEAAVMLLLPSLGLHGIWEVVADSVLLSLIVLGPLYLLGFRASPLPRYEQNKIDPLLRTFVFASLAAVVAIGLLAGLNLRHELRAAATHEAEDSATHLAVALRDSSLQSLLGSAADGVGIAISTEAMPVLDREVRIFLAPFEVVKLKVFDLERRIIYCTDPSLIGEVNRDNARLEAALAGRVWSELEKKGSMVDLASESRLDVDVVETYVPIQDAGGRVRGAMEIYQDITDAIAVGEASWRRAVLTLIIVLTCVFSALAALMHRATRIIRAHVRDLEYSRGEILKLSTAVEQSPASVIVTDTEGTILYVNPRFTETTGYQAAEALGRNPRMLRSTNMSSSEHRQMWETIRGGRVWQGEFYNTKKNGQRYWDRTSIAPIRDASGRITSYVAVKEDVTQRKRSEEQLELAATTDRLTGLPNRAVLIDRIDQALKRAKRDQTKWAVLFFDFDRFKVVNDSLGHDVGDALLRDIAGIFRRELRDTDTVARIGGDEFVVLLGNLAEWSDAREKADKLVRVFAEPHRLDGHVLVSTASVGLVTNEHGYDDAGAVVRDADAAMYEAKAGGRGRVVVFDEAMHAKAMECLALEADLRTAGGGDQLRRAYQPIVHLATGELAGFEALLRWEHPQRGTLQPLDFIGIAEETELIVPIGRWVYQTAAAQLSEWNRRLGLDHALHIAVNVSKRQLLDPGFVDEIVECRRACGLHPGELQLEITESVVADARSDVAPLLRRLRENGFSIAMDDFGTGVSSLSALHEYPIDVLKIDRSFIRVLDTDRSLLAIVSSITSLAENLQIKTTAEGIESEQIIGALQSIDCTWGQGFHFARPMSPVDAEAYIVEHRRQQGLRAA